MKTHDHALIALLLDRVEPPADVARWLATPVGRRELAAYRRTLAHLESAFGTVRLPAARPVIHYCSLRSPIGRVLVAASPAGLVRVSFRRSEAQFAADLRRSFGVEPVRSAPRTADIVHQLRAYFGGARRSFDVRLDLGGITPFQRRVLLAATTVPAGQVVSYGEIARRIGQPHGSRAVGQALGHNPIPIIIPCHRIVAAGGRLGGYTGGLDVKKKLLRLEGALAAVG